MLLHFPGMNNFRKIFTSMLARRTSSHRLLFQMCLPAETTVLIFGGYEQILSKIVCFELCFWMVESCVFMADCFESKAPPVFRRFAIKEKFKSDRCTCFSDRCVPGKCRRMSTGRSGRNQSYLYLLSKSCSAEVQFFKGLFSNPIHGL